MKARTKGCAALTTPTGLDPAALPVVFRLSDDDWEVYYEGRMARVDFEPLDDFGLGNASCTELRYWVNGQWETL